VGGFATLVSWLPPLGEPRDVGHEARRWSLFHGGKAAGNRLEGFDDAIAAFGAGVADVDGEEWRSRATSVDGGGPDIVSGRSTVRRRRRTASLEGSPSCPGR
jgi:hypothetical protein